MIIVEIVRRGMVQLVCMRHEIFVLAYIGVQMESAQRNRQKRNAGKHNNKSGS